MLAWSVLVLINHFRQAQTNKNEDKGTGRLPNLAAERSAALQGLVPKTTSGQNDSEPASEPILPPPVPFAV